MSQSDFNIDNQSRSLVRAEMNTALQALATCSSGASAPTTTYPFQFWADTSLGLLKQRNAANTAWISVLVLATGAVVDGSVTPAKLSTGAPTWNAAGEFTVTAPSLLGYGTGAGGTVTQLTSKGTAVTLNKPVGQIISSNSALGAGVETFFLVNNTVINLNDLIIINGNLANSYSYRTSIASAGSFSVFIKNNTAGSLSDALTMNFSIIKGAVS